MGVYKRPDSPFYWLRLEGYTDTRGRPRREPTRVRHDAPTPTQRRENRQLAEARFHDRMHALAKGEIEGPRAAITFGAFLEWWEQHRLPQRKGQERDRYILTRLRADFGAERLAAIDHARVEEWITARLATPTVLVQGQAKRRRIIPATPSTVNREVDLLKSIVQAAVPRYLPRSPLYGMKRLRTETPKRRTLTETEEDKILAVLAPADRALVLVGIDGLCRLSDILDLRREDDHGAYLYIRDPKDPEQSTPYTVPVSTRLRHALDAVPGDDPYYFAHRRQAAQRRDWRSSVRQMLKRACAKTKVPFGRARGGITFHWATRRTGASRMIAHGVDPKTVQRIGHWASAELVLDIYAEAIDANATRAVEVLGQRTRRA